jgi:hypothetical protein
VSTDGNGLRDELTALLTGPGATASTVSTRPALDAPKAAWVDYCVALGADRAHLEGGTAHWSDTAGGHVEAEAPTKAGLIELADRLGG